MPALVLSFASFLTQLDVTAAIVALPTISDDLGFGIAGDAWVMDAYSLAFTATLLASGALTDRYGRRRMMLIGNLLFALASLACGLAWDGPSLWAARTAQGSAAAFVITGSIALIAAEYPDVSDRSRAFGLGGIVAGIAMAIGPTLGGAVTALWGWRWIFFANLPFCALGAWAVPRLIAESHGGERRPLDIASIVLITVALGSAIETLLSAHTLSHAAIGGGSSIVLAAAFAVRQRRQTHPLLDPAFLAQPATVAIALLLITVSIGYWAVLVYLPLYLTKTFGVSVQQSGAMLLIATLPMIFLPPLAGRLATDWGWRRLFTTGLVLIAAGDAMLALGSTRMIASLIPAVGGMIAIAVGTALVQSQLSGAVVTLAAPAQAGMASALTIVMRQGGFAIGIALLGALLDTGQRVEAYVEVFSAAALAALVGAAAAAMLLPRVNAPVR